MRWFVALIALLVAMPLPVSAASLPADLRPPLKRALQDAPASYFDGCHVGVPAPYIHCVYGNASSPVSIALFGDSHAGQWFSAVFRAVRVRGWRLDNYTRSSCPSVSVQVMRGASVATDCDDFRARAEADMAAHPPTVVLISNLRDYPLVDQTPDYETAWDAGLARTLAALPASSVAIVVSDTPRPYPEDVPKCLTANPHHIKRCQGSTWINAVHNGNERATAESAGATFASFNGVICPKLPCPVILGDILVYRDTNHLTATLVKSLWRNMAAILDPAVARQ